MKKKIYVALSADMLHKGHFNILNKAASLGEITVGLLTDKAIGVYKQIPFLNYSQREIILKNLKMVKNVVPQHTLDYRPNLRKIKPDFVVHGDDWKKGILKKTRLQVISELRKWSGKLIEVPYTKNISSSSIKSNIMKLYLQKYNRTSLLSRLIKVKDIVRIIEAHSPLSGLIAEKMHVKEKNQASGFLGGNWKSTYVAASFGYQQGRD